MEEHYKSIHIISEAVILGGLSVFFFKKISDLESTLEELKQQIITQNNQIRYLLSLSATQPTMTPLRPTLINEAKDREAFHRSSANSVNTNGSRQMECSGGVCTLAPSITQRVIDRPMDSRKALGMSKAHPHALALAHPERGGVAPKGEGDKKVVISKISKQFEFDTENNDLGLTFLSEISKVNTFTKFSPNPVINSVTPKPSTSITDLDDDEEGESEGHGEGEDINELNKILNEIARE